MRTDQTRSMPTRFHLVLIKPTHYDDNGYPIQWIKAAIPSNRLACLNGLAEDASRRRVLGSDVVSSTIVPPRSKYIFNLWSSYEIQTFARSRARPARRAGGEVDGRDHHSRHRPGKADGR